MRLVQKAFKWPTWGNKLAKTKAILIIEKDDKDSGGWAMDGNMIEVVGLSSCSL